MRTIKPKAGEKVKLPVSSLPVKVALSDGTEILLKFISLWRISRQAKGGHAKQVYLIDPRHFDEKNPTTVGRKLLLEEEELVLGKARNPVYFGHQDWSKKMQMEEAKVWLEGKNICVEGL